MVRRTGLSRSAVQRGLKALGSRVVRDSDGYWRPRSFEERVHERLLERRLAAIEAYRRENPIFGQFSPEQYARLPGIRGVLERWRRARQQARERRIVENEIRAES